MKHREDMFLDMRVGDPMALTWMKDGSLISH